jgi:hypothetical protein
MGVCVLSGSGAGDEWRWQHFQELTKQGWHVYSVTEALQVSTFICKCLLLVRLEEREWLVFFECSAMPIGAGARRNRASRG